MAVRNALLAATAHSSAGAVTARFDQAKHVVFDPEAHEDDAGRCREAAEHEQHRGAVHVARDAVPGPETSVQQEPAAPGEETDEPERKRYR